MTYEEAIKAIKDNKPTRGYTILCEALDIAIECIEKQIPKTPTLQGGKYKKCPICGSLVVFKSCTECGQIIDWSE